VARRAPVKIEDESQVNESMNLKLNAHVAVVTGGADGTGLVCAQGLAREGQIAFWDVASSVAKAAGTLASAFGVLPRRAPKLPWDQPHIWSIPL
jgi:hypothetical protein